MDEVMKLLDYLEIQSPQARETFAQLAQHRHLKRGEVLYKGVEDTTFLYFLISGSLRGIPPMQPGVNTPSVCSIAMGTRTSAASAWSWSRRSISIKISKR